MNATTPPGAGPAARTARSMAGDCLVVTFERPEARNALDRAMVAELRELLDDIRVDRPSACVLTGTGPVFCAGGDLKERRAMTKDEVRRLRREIVDLFTAMPESPVPLIAALNGSAWGGGFELALACDFIVASAAAELGLPEVGLGIIPAGGGTQNLVRLGGVALAREVIVLGRVLTAPDAHAAGLVLSVHEPDNVVDAALQVARRIAARPRLAVRQARQAINDAWGYSMAVALRRENELYDPCIDDAARDTALEQFANRS